MTVLYSRPRSVYARDPFPLWVVANASGTVVVGDARPPCPIRGNRPPLGSTTVYSPAGESTISWSGLATVVFDQSVPQQATVDLLALDGDGNAYSLAPDAVHIIKSSPNGEILDVIGNGTAQFQSPVSAVVDTNALWVTDNNRLLRISFTTHTVSQFGKPFRSPTSQQDGASSPAGELNLAMGVALDRDGNAYVVDFRHARVQVLSPNTGAWRAFVRLVDGPWQFDYPTQIAIDHENNVYVVDTGNHRIQKGVDLWRGAWPMAGTGMAR